MNTDSTYTYVILVVGEGLQSFHRGSAHNIIEKDSDAVMNECNVIMQERKREVWQEVMHFAPLQREGSTDAIAFSQSVLRPRL